MKDETTEHKTIHESQHGEGPLNFDITKYGDELDVVLTYPPRTDTAVRRGQCKYITINQQSVRASDGVRLYYDYNRDGFVVEQPRPRLVALGDKCYEDHDDWD